VIDLPENVSQDVKDLVEFGLNKDPDFRPTAAELLQHKAFKILGLYFQIRNSNKNTKIKLSSCVKF